MQAEPERRSSPSKPAGLTARFVHLWWHVIPSKLRSYSTLLWASWKDGSYLTAWPSIATTLVVMLFVFGFAEGLTHWSYRTIVGSNNFAGNVLAPSATADGWGGPTRLVFAENLLLLIIAVAAGSLSANLGLTLVISYALGDLLHGPFPPGPGWRNIDPVNAWIYRHVPLLVSYLLFFLVACLPIVMARELARSAFPRSSHSRLRKVALTAGIQAVLIYCWALMAPMVFRTVWLWPGGMPRITVPFYSHVAITWLVPIAIAGVVARAWLTRSAEPEIGVQAAPGQNESGPAGQALPRWLHALIVSGVITLLITGFLHTPENYDPGYLGNYAEAELIFVLLTALFLVSMYWLPHLAGWQQWTSNVERYPALLRLGTATAASYLVSRMIIAMPGAQSSKGGEFGPEVVGILVGLLLTIVLLPHGWFGIQPASRFLPTLPFLARSRAAQAGLVGIIVLLSTRKAFADCFDYCCCFLCQSGIAAGAAAGSIPGLGGVAGGMGRRSDPCQKERDAVQSAEELIQSLQELIKTEEEQLQSWLQQFAQLLLQLQSEGFAAMGEAALNPALASIVSTLQAELNSVGNPAMLLMPGTDPLAFFSNPALSVFNNVPSLVGAAMGLAQTGIFPLTQNFLNDVSRIPGQLASANVVVNLVKDLQKQLQDAQAQLQGDEAALARCEASHRTGEAARA